MGDEGLVAEVIGRLEADGTVKDDVSLLVLAALTGELTTHLDEGAVPVKPAAGTGPAPEPAHAYVKSVAVNGFRGIGPEARLDLGPGPGLTLVVGRNGSGKSSFAEALELLLTGDNQRWSASRSKQWSKGWRNLHAGAEPAIKAEMLIDGVPGPTLIRRRWKPEADLALGVTDTLTPGGAPQPLADLGWEQAISAHRPFLSYNELGSMLEEGPSRLHDALGAILGLEALTVAATDLATARLARSKQHTQVKDTLKKLTAALAAIADERAERCLAAVKPRVWDLDAVAATVVAGVAAPADTGLLARLRDWSDLHAPAAETVVTAATEVEVARSAMAALHGSDADRADRLARLLERAIDWHDHQGDGDCPVCGNGAALDPAWHTQAAAEAARLGAEAKKVREAGARNQAAAAQLKAVIRSPPTSLAPAPAADGAENATPAGIDPAPVRAAWAALIGVATGDGAKLTAGVAAANRVLDAALTSLRSAAAAALLEREEAWRPVAVELAAWLPGARRLQAEGELVKRLKSAEDWLRTCETTIRNERFQPIKDEVKAIWSQLRTQSSVELEDIVFAGKSTGRRIDLEVTVDGTPGVALGVMSQGELHSLALSLFLPRATLASSPFRFLFIDDPVQAMDPARVDGLARVLERVARERQVVVFTHDDRLPEAVRRLGIGATHIEVQRREGSAVDVRAGRDPVAGYIDDARVLLSTRELPAEIIGRVVPGLCRQSIEAACFQAYRARRLAKGDGHGAVEAALTSNHTLMQRLALAIFGDAERAGDVLKKVNTWGGWAGDVVQACNKGAHGEIFGDPEAFVRDTFKLSQRLQGLT